MSGPMQLMQDGTWRQAIGSSQASAPTASEDDFNAILASASPHPRLAPLSGPTAPPAKPPPKRAAFKTENVLTLARARLKEVRTELRKMAALEKERAELERLIAAAENKPKAVVTALKPTRIASGT